MYLSHSPECNFLIFLVRFRLQAATLWPCSEVRGQTGSTGAAGEKIQGQLTHRRRIIIGSNIMYYCHNVKVFVVLMNLPSTRRRSATCWTTCSRPGTFTRWWSRPLTTWWGARWRSISCFITASTRRHFSDTESRSLNRSVDGGWWRLFMLKWYTFDKLIICAVCSELQEKTVFI